MTESKTEPPQGLLKLRSPSTDLQATQYCPPVHSPHTALTAKIVHAPLHIDVSAELTWPE